MKNKISSTRFIVVTALLAAIAAVLQFLEFSIPLIPSFIKLDFSDLPALIASFSMGPVSGVIVCVLKNLIHLVATQSAGIGELANCLLGILFVLPAGLIYKYNKTRRWAFFGSLIGCAAMAVGSLLTNYFIVYPFYTAFMPMDVILGMYQAINPAVKTLWDALLMFNLPFTFAKGLISVVVTFLVYKKLSPILKGS